MNALLVLLGVAAGLAWLFFDLWRAEQKWRHHWEQEYDRWRERYFDVVADVNEILREQGRREISPRITLGDDTPRDRAVKNPDGTP